MSEIQLQIPTHPTDQSSSVHTCKCGHLIADILFRHSHEDLVRVKYSAIYVYLIYIKPEAFAKRQYFRRNIDVGAMRGVF